MAYTFSTNVCNRARIAYGVIGSTFPLLEIEALRFARFGSTAAICATGCRPLSLMSTNTSSDTKMSPIQNRRLINLQSILRCLSLRLSKRRVRLA